MSTQFAIIVGSGFDAFAGDDEMPIHEDVESSTLSAKTQAMQVFKQFFKSR